MPNHNMEKTMNLSKTTLDTLANFASINQNLVFCSNVLRTRTESKSVVAVCNIEENFPYDFGIYDLGDFLRSLKLVGETPRLSFDSNEKYVTMQGENASVKYFFSNKNHLTTPEKEKINLIENAMASTKDKNVNLVLTAEDLTKIRSASSVLKVPFLVIEGQPGSVPSYKVLDINDPTSNVFTLQITGSPVDQKFSIVFSIANLALLEKNDYNVEISPNQIAKLVSTTSNNGLFYFVAVEQTSKFG